MQSLETEIIPLPEELEAYEGLKEIRYRIDGGFALGLFFREVDKQTVLTMLPRNEVQPFVFPIAPETANAAFEGPWPYVPIAGRIVLEQAWSTTTTAQAA